VSVCESLHAARYYIVVFVFVFVGGVTACNALLALSHLHSLSLPSRSSVLYYLLLWVWERSRRVLNAENAKKIYMENQKILGESNGK